MRTALEPGSPYYTVVDHTKHQRRDREGLLLNTALVIPRIIVGFLRAFCVKAKAEFETGRRPSKKYTQGSGVMFLLSLILTGLVTFALYALHPPLAAFFAFPPTFALAMFTLTQIVDYRFSCSDEERHSILHGEEYLRYNNYRTILAFYGISIDEAGISSPQKPRTLQPESVVRAAPAGTVRTGTHPNAAPTRAQAAQRVERGDIIAASVIGFLSVGLVILDHVRDRRR